jgi:hypothetical protein
MSGKMRREASHASSISNPAASPKGRLNFFKKRQFSVDGAEASDKIDEAGCTLPHLSFIADLII